MLLRVCFIYSPSIEHTQYSLFIWDTKAWKLIETQLYSLLWKNRPSKNRLPQPSPTHRFTTPLSPCEFLARSKHTSPANLKSFKTSLVYLAFNMKKTPFEKSNYTKMEVNTALYLYCRWLTASIWQTFNQNKRWCHYCLLCS